MRKYPTRHSRFKAALLLCVIAFAPSSFAQEADDEASAGANAGADQRAQCFEAHRAAQELKRVSRFVEAHEHLLICSEAACPGAIIEDCGSWLTDLERLTPSVVFQVHVDGHDAPDASIFIDEVAVENTSGGVPLNPGLHTMRAEVPGREPLVQKVNLPAGQRMRLVTFNFESAPAAATSSAQPADKAARPVPVAVYPLLGVGVAGLAAFGVLASLGKVEQNELKDTCAPNCSDDDMSKMKTMYLIGDISAGVGAAALVAAGIVYLVRPVKKERSTDVSFAVDPTRKSFGVFAAGHF